MRSAVSRVTPAFWGAVFHSAVWAIAFISLLCKATYSWECRISRSLKRVLAMSLPQCKITLLTIGHLTHWLVLRGTGADWTQALVHAKPAPTTELFSPHSTRLVVLCLPLFLCGNLFPLCSCGFFPLVISHAVQGNRLLQYSYCMFE